VSEDGEKLGIGRWHWEWRKGYGVRVVMKPTWTAEDVRKAAEFAQTQAKQLHIKLTGWSPSYWQQKAATREISRKQFMELIHDEDTNDAETHKALLSVPERNVEDWTDNEFANFENAVTSDLEAFAKVIEDDLEELAKLIDIKGEGKTLVELMLPLDNKDAYHRITHNFAWGEFWDETHLHVDKHTRKQNVFTFST